MKNLTRTGKGTLWANRKPLEMPTAHEEHGPTMKRHASSQAFHDVLAEMAELHDRKQADYGLDDDPFANVRASESFGIAGWVGCMTRANDKMRRLMKAAKGGVMRNESVEDSLLDLAVYAVIGLVLYRESRKS
jgi:hypothetical protein